MAEQRLIDADALLEKRRSFYEPRELESIAPIASTCITTDDVYRAPTIDAVPVVHARWKRRFEDWRQQIEGDECSACGFKHYGSSIDQYHYCPNCGAKMDGGVDT